MAKLKLSNTNWRLSGTETFSTAGWQHIYGSLNATNEDITLTAKPGAKVGQVGYIDLGLGATDRVSLGLNGDWVLSLTNVEYVRALRANTNVNVKFVQSGGFTTDGSLKSISLDVGHQDLYYTGATLDSTLFMGQGYDRLFLNGTSDFDNYWSFVRRDKGQLDAYNLFSGNRVRLQDANGLNWGQIELITTADGKNGGNDVYNPSADLKHNGDNGSNANIDLRSDGVAYSGSFNLANFNSIRYTSDNIWRGEANITTTIGGTRASTAGNTSDTGATALDVIGTYRNGTHDLIVTEQTTALAGQFRLYAANVASGLYNTFNDVYLGSAGNNVADYHAKGSGLADRVAVYGFGGNDVLTGGAGKDYLFGGQSIYTQLDPTNGRGNQVTGGAGADYFGVGNTNSAGTVTGGNTIVDGGQLQGYGTDVITDWDARTDSLVVLSNGVAVIGGLYGVTGMAGDNSIDLRSHTAVAVSDQNASGALGGTLFNADKTKTAAAWDASQAARDVKSISNEADLTVVNNGLIVARGGDGNDTISDSSGNDYLYGNKGNNSLDLSADGNDRVYLDTLFGKQYVTGFDADNAHTASHDLFYVDKRVIDSLYSAGSGRSLTAVDASATGMTTGVHFNAGVDYLYSGFYQNALSGYGPGPYSNAQHDQADTTADVKTIAIGAPMVALGYVLIFFGGGALVAAGGLLIANGQQHQNLTYDGQDLSNYLNVLSNTEPVFSTVGTADNLQFLDFFSGSNVGDGFAPALEFSSVTGGIHTYVAVHTNNETIVYLLNSSDKVIENSEAIKVAEINGILTANDFVVYNGAQDIYNQVDPADLIISLSTPTITEVSNAASPLITANLDRVYSPGSTIALYDGSVLVVDPVRLDTDTTHFTLTDSRTLSAGVEQVDSDPLTEANIFKYNNVTANYSIWVTDGATGLVTKSNVMSTTITDIASDYVINGGDSDDTLLLDRTSSHLNSAADDKIINLENIDASSMNSDTPGVGVLIDLHLQSEGFHIEATNFSDTIYGGAGADTIHGGDGVDNFYLGAAVGVADVVRYAASTETDSSATAFVNGGTTVGMDVIHDAALGDKISLWSAVFTGTPTLHTDSYLAATTAGNFAIVRGSLDGVNHTFTQGTSGTDNDYMVQWADGSSINSTLLQDFGTTAPTLTMDGVTDTLTLATSSQMISVSQAGIWFDTNEDGTVNGTESLLVYAPPSSPWDFAEGVTGTEGGIAPSSNFKLDTFTTTDLPPVSIINPETHAYTVKFWDALGPTVDLTGFGADDKVVVDLSVAGYMGLNMVGPAPTLATNGSIHYNLSNYVPGIFTATGGSHPTQIGSHYIITGSSFVLTRSTWTTSGSVWTTTGSTSLQGHSTPSGHSTPTGHLTMIGHSTPNGILVPNGSTTAGYNQKNSVQLKVFQSRSELMYQYKTSFKPSLHSSHHTTKTGVLAVNVVGVVSVEFIMPNL